MEFADEIKRQQWIADKGMQVFAMYHPDKPGMTVDLFVHHPIPYQELLDLSVVMDLDGISVRVCSIDDLIAMKAAGQHKDLADIEQLTKIKEYEKDKSSE